MEDGQIVEITTNPAAARAAVADQAAHSLEPA
jgi:hypothetical protein